MASRSGSNIQVDLGTVERLRLYWFCHDIWTDAITMAARTALPKRDISFLCCRYSLGAVLQRREVFDVVIQHSHLQDMLSHSGPLGLAHRLLNVELLPFGCISTEDCGLMQLKTVLEGHPCLWTPTFGHLTIYSSPQVALMHLVEDKILLGLCITRQEVPQLLVRLGNCLVVSLLGFLEQLLNLFNLHLVGLNINICQDGVLRTRVFLEILQHLRPLYNGLGKHPTLLGQPLLINDLEDCNNVCKVFLVVPMGVNGHVEVGLVRKLDLENLRFFLGCDDVNLRYVRNGQPVAQLPFLTLGILQPAGRLEGGTHFGMLPESGTKEEFLERRLWWNL
jgi:hypothetical protein